MRRNSATDAGKPRRWRSASARQRPDASITARPPAPRPGRGHNPPLGNGLLTCRRRLPDHGVQLTQLEASISPVLSHQSASILRRAERTSVRWLAAGSFGKDMGCGSAEAKSEIMSRKQVVTAPQGLTDERNESLPISFTVRRPADRRSHRNSMTAQPPRPHGGDSRPTVPVDSPDCLHQ